MASEDLEILICRYIDGELTPEQRANFEALLADDVPARQMLEEHRRLDEALRAQAMPLVRWERLQQHLSAAVREKDLPKKTIFAPVYQMPWIRPMAAVAMAASVLLAIGFSLHLIQSRRSANNNIVAKAPQAIELPKVIALAEVTGPLIEAPTGTASDEITLGPPPNLSAQMDMGPGADSIVVQPSQVAIASAFDGDGTDHAAHQ
jgi:anti-sigma factor RsiW